MVDIKHQRKVGAVDINMKRKLNRREKIRLIYALLDVFFEGRVKKTEKWMRTQNLLLGGFSPLSMLEIGREDKLLKFIKNQLEENRRLK